MTAPTWDLLMSSIAHRHDRLCLLLAELDRQMLPGVGLRIFYDNLETRVGEKYHALAHSSTADYLSVLEDDDWVAPDFIARILKALERRPDYVGFPVRWTHDGRVMMPVEHSLRYSGWRNTGTMLERDLNQFNPMRRELALLGTYCTPPPELNMAWDYFWTIGVRESGLCKDEEWIPEPMHYYRTTSGDGWETRREPLPASAVLPVPRYPWLVEVGAWG